MLNKLRVEFENLRGISHCDVDIPLEPDVYAITGINGIGKSTLMMAISPIVRSKREFTPAKRNFSSFRNIDFNENTYIKYTIGEKYEIWKPQNDNWKITDTNGHILIFGFQEGSITRGTRFWNTTSRSLKKIANVDISDLLHADEFIIKHLSRILKGDENHYKELYRIDLSLAGNKYGYDGVPYFIVNGKELITQFDMSTGECLIINLLHLLHNLLRKNFPSSVPKLILIDEIELALHPSAINRLVIFMRELAHDHNLAVYFATHSIEIIRNLNPDNLFYLVAANNHSIKCKTPCYPAYVTRDIYMADGYDAIILVEDDLAKNIVIKVVKDIELATNQIIQVLPVGGYSNTLELHNNLLEEKVLVNRTKVLSIIDGDVKDEAMNKFIAKKKDKMLKCLDKEDIMFLPIPSLEKYLKHKLCDQPDLIFIRTIRDYYFKYSSSIEEFLLDYRNEIENEKKRALVNNKPIKMDNEYFADGKTLLSTITEFAKKYGWSKEQFRKDICDFVMKYEDFSIFKEELKVSLIKYFK